MSGATDGKSGWAGDREHRYVFFLNPYSDAGFTRCPQCEGKTKVRMFCLFIHVDPDHPISFNMSCRFCPGCELIIKKKDELEANLAVFAEQYAPEANGNDYFVVGTLDRSLHRQGKAGQLDQKTALDACTPFRDHVEFTPGGWGPPEDSRQRLDPPSVRAITAVAPASDSAKIGRNDPCPCGSGRKYKRCCARKEAQ